MGLTGKKIVLITSGQPSLNPRLVKEADALIEAGFDVTVIYQYWNDWGTKLDTELLPQKKWKTIRVGGDPLKEKTTYWLSRVKLKISQKLVRILGFKFGLPELAIGRCTFQLLQAAKQIHASLYIAHNLAALPAAITTAKKHGAKCGFDAEDFHRYEMSDSDLDPDVKLKSYLEEKYFPETDYLTTSSPEIAKRYELLFPTLKFTTLLNVFPRNSMLPKVEHSHSQPLKLFWFSQNVGLSRGLQDVIAALKYLENEALEFHILGFLSNAVHTALQEIIAVEQFVRPPKIIFHQPIPSTALTEFASQFDIGLATEPGFSINNDIALSNKLFTYAQAGLAIIASDTSAQKNFMDSYPNMGFVYEKKNPEDLATVIKNYIKHNQLLENHRKNALLCAQNELNWEQEQKKFLVIIKHLLC